MNDSELLYEYKNKNTTLVQPEVSFGVYPPSKTEKKLVSRYVYSYGSLELKEFVKEQYWKLVDFFHGQPGGGEREISYTRETGLTLQRFEEIASKLGISSSQEVGVDGLKLGYKVSQELSRLIGESITITEKTSKQHITKIPPQPFEWYFAVYQLIDVYTINTVNSGKSYTLADKIKIDLEAEFKIPGIADNFKIQGIREEINADLAKINFESGLEQYSNMSNYTFKSQTFEVPTLYFCEKCDPPLK